MHLGLQSDLQWYVSQRQSIRYGSTHTSCKAVSAHVNGHMKSALTNSKRLSTKIGCGAGEPSEIERIMDDTMLGVKGLVFVHHDWMLLPEDRMDNGRWRDNRTVKS